MVEASLLVIAFIVFQLFLLFTVGVDLGEIGLSISSVCMYGLGTCSEWLL